MVDLFFRGGVLAQVEELQRKAIEEDPSVFAYDEVYDDMKEKAARPKMQAKVVRQVIIRPGPAQSNFH